MGCEAASPLHCQPMGRGHHQKWLFNALHAATSRIGPLDPVSPARHFEHHIKSPRGLAMVVLAAPSTHGPGRYPEPAPRAPRW